jgi:hypothetical protein
VSKDQKEVSAGSIFSESNLKLPQPSDCHEHQAHNVEGFRKGVDCTGIGSVGCAWGGFFIPCATVDFQRGEK